MPQMLMEEAPVAVQEPPATGPAQRWSADEWWGLIALAAAMIAGLVVYSGFWTHSHDLWWWMGHDRHSHYMYGLNLALDLRTGDIVRLFHDFDRMRVWGPIHPISVALIELVAGPNHRLAVLPSLCAFVAAIFFAFLTARRLLPEDGNFAGLLAAFFVAISPAHRAYATDVMYESLGAGLSLACLYFYLVTVQDQSRRAAVALGVALSVLFLHKYNYWLLVVFGLTLGEFARQPRAWCEYGLSLCRRDRLPSWVLVEIKQPLNWIAVALAGIAIGIAATGGGVLALGTWNVSIQEPHNFVHLAYVAVFIRVVLWWRQTGREWSLTLPPTVRNVTMWHGGAIALWFLMPKRLSYFLWYLGPNNDDQKRESVPFLHGLPYYLQGLQEDYLPAAWGLMFLAAMLVLALIAWRWLRPGAAAVFFFLVIAAFLTCQHPMLKYRFMHSWIAAVWVLGAVGLIFAVQKLTAWLSAPLRTATAGVVALGVIGLHIPAILTPAHAQEGGLKPDLPSPLRITETYLPALKEARNPTIVSNVSTRFLWTWTFIEHHRHQNMAAEIKNFRTYEGNPEQARRWLKTTRSDALVLIDIRPHTTYDWKTDEYVDLSAFHQALGQQSAWVYSERWEMREGVTITLWRKTP